MHLWPKSLPPPHEFLTLHDYQKNFQTKSKLPIQQKSFLVKFFLILCFRIFFIIYEFVYKVIKNRLK